MSGQPSFVIDFTRKAVTAITRSQQGTAVLVLSDETLAENTKTYSLFSEVNKEEVDAKTYELLQLCFLGSPYKVILVKQQEAIADTVKILQKLDFNYMAMPGADAAAVTAIKDYLVKARASLDSFGKAVFYKPETPCDSQRIIELAGCENLKLNFTGEEKSYTGGEYTCRIVGILAGLSDTVSATYTKLDEIVSCDIEEDPDAAADDGYLVPLFKNGEYKLGRAVNSLTTLTDGVSADFQKIRIVSTLDLIAEDIVTTFRDDYVGKYVNDYANKVRFCGAINTYLQGLTPNLLDENMTNKVKVSFSKNKAYLEGQGISTADMSEQQVLQYNTGSYVGLEGSCAPTDVMEDLDLDFNLFEEA